MLPITTACSAMDWECEPLLGMLERMVRELASLPLSYKLWMLTDSALIEGMAHKAGAGRILLAETAGGGWARAPLADFAEERFGLEAPVLLLDQRNPMLTAAALQEAAELYLRAGGAPVVSVTTPEDHPVQLRTLYNVTDTGLLHLLDPAPPAAIGCRAQAVSASFWFDWRIAGGGEPDDALFRAAGNLLVPIGLEGPACGESVWLKDGPASARVAFGQAVPAWACGFAMSANGPMFLSRAEGKLFLHCKQEDNTLMRLVPFTNAGLLHEKHVLVTLGGTPVCLGEFQADITGFVFTAQQAVQGGPYGQETMFSPDRQHWCAKTQRSADGRKLFGRQSFPTTYQVDPSLFVGTAAQLRSLPELLGQGAVRGFDLGCGPCLVQSPIDLLRHAARNRAARQGAGGAL